MKPITLTAFLLAFSSVAPASPTCSLTATWPAALIKSQSAKNKNLFGRGIKIAVVDSGIDRDHPAFRTVKIVGRDFIGGNEAAPYSYFDNEGHGTHVAGIIAGRDCLGNPIGLAPRASLYVARVCGAEGCKSEEVAAGVEWAISQRVDVINISIEGDRLHTSPREMAAVRKAIASGIAVVTISGNGGDQGSSNSIASIEGVIVAGAVNKGTEKPFFSQIGMQTLAAPGVNILSASPQGKGYVVHGASSSYAPDLVHLINTPVPQAIDAEVAYVGFGTQEDMPKARGKIAVAEQGGDVGIDDKAKAAEKSGARALIVLMNGPYFTSGLQTLETIKIPVLLSSKAEKEQFLSLSQNRILLGLDTETGDYILESGTSMAAPFVTGAVALLKEVKRDLSPQQARDILVRSATRTNFNGSPLEDSPFGAGILNIEEALEAIR